MWAKIKELATTIIDLVKSCINIGNRLANLSPVGYLKKLSDTEDPQSAHAAINVLWGLGSFFCFWIDHFYRTWKTPSQGFTSVDYIFITVMSGISSWSALKAKQVDSATYLSMNGKEELDDAEPVKKPVVTPPATKL